MDSTIRQMVYIMDDKDKLISIVVPVYNVEEYVEKCIKSLVEQSYSYIEIIIVDDGSLDSSIDKCISFARNDDRIRIYQKKNGGLSDARNYGITKCSGSYIMFVDSDDYLPPYAVSCLYTTLCKYPEAALSIGSMYITSDNRCEIKKTSNAEPLFLNSEKAIYELLLNEMFTNSVCAKLFRKELFETVKFPVGRLYEDIPVCYDIFLSGVSVVYTSQIVYVYYKRPNSITTVSFNPKRMDGVLFVEDKVNKLLEMYPQYRKTAKIRLFKAYFNVLPSLTRDKVSKDYWKMVKKNLKKYRWCVLFSFESSLKLKAKAILSILPYTIIQRFINK